MCQRGAARGPQILLIIHNPLTHLVNQCFRLRTTLLVMLPHLLAAVVCEPTLRRHRCNANTMPILIKQRLAGQFRYTEPDET